jgi:hypothetical protein
MQEVRDAAKLLGLNHETQDFLYARARSDCIELYEKLVNDARVLQEQFPKHACLGVRELITKSAVDLEVPGLDQMNLQQHLDECLKRLRDDDDDDDVAAPKSRSGFVSSVFFVTLVGLSACAFGLHTLNCSPWYSLLAGGTCKCYPGFMFTDKAASACSPCPGGTFSTLGGREPRDRCLSCKPGKFSGPGSASCGLCAAGEYAPKARMETCDECAPGKFANDRGASVCRVCPPGQFCGRAGCSSCEMCEPGTFANGSPERMPTICKCCPQNYYAPRGSFECKPCGPFHSSGSCSGECSYGGITFATESIMGWVQKYFQETLDMFFDGAASTFESAYNLWYLFSPARPPESANNDARLCSSEFIYENGRVATRSSRWVRSRFEELDEFKAFDAAIKKSPITVKECKALARKCFFYLHPDKFAQNFNCKTLAEDRNHAQKLAQNLTIWFQQERAIACGTKKPET